jgi:methylated-DNA-[protein]-cysteine S-methyltransferase
VGLAAGANPVAILVPCHRVVAHGLELGGFRAGLGRKIWLLEREGAKVNGGRVAPGQLGLL